MYTVDFNRKIDSVVIRGNLIIIRYLARRRLKKKKKKKETPFTEMNKKKNQKKERDVRQDSRKLCGRY